VDAPRLLGRANLEQLELTAGKRRVELELPAEQAALLAARLRGLGIDGETLQVETAPGLSRALVRAGRLAEARERRVTTPGFTRSAARATGEGRFSLTPESLALRMGELAAGRTVVEACVGSGGNTVGFARAGCMVTGFEIDPDRLVEARHNVALFGGSSRVKLAAADALLEVPRHAADILFIDPPWGGEQYDKRFTERASFPVLDRLLAKDLSAYGEIWIKVPSSFRVATVPGAEPSAWFGEAAGDRHRIKFVLLRVGMKGA
jgi:16S rRNA G966 N2-methylase RsmD